MRTSQFLLGSDPLAILNSIFGFAYDWWIHNFTYSKSINIFLHPLSSITIPSSFLIFKMDFANVCCSFSWNMIFFVGKMFHSLWEIIKWSLGFITFFWVDKSSFFPAHLKEEWMSASSNNFEFYPIYKGVHWRVEMILIFTSEIILSSLLNGNDFWRHSNEWS